ncbi:MAG TPA: site-specific integrase [Terriglobia bacterium]|nr:site-specific integrase [Terriglobia bacterium]
MTLLRRQSASTLGYVDGFYEYAEELLGQGRLDDAFASLDVQLLSQSLEGYFQFLRNHPNKAPAERWQAVSQFAGNIIMRLATAAPAQAGLADLQGRLARIEASFSKLRVRTRRMPEPIRSLPADVVEALYNLLDPASGSNPFRTSAMKWRVYAAYLLMLHQGLRRGELLSLASDPVKSGFDGRAQRQRSWITVRYNPYEDDPRYSRPAIKTPNSQRQIPISDSIVSVVDAYVINHRGRPTHSFLMNSQKNRPLSTEALTKVFAKISSCLSKGTRKVLYEHTGEDSVSPHDLRHTCAVYRLKRMLDEVGMEEALQLLRAFFGWARTSDMPLRYARAVFEDRLATVWQTHFDASVEVLRGLEAVK